MRITVDFGEDVLRDVMTLTGEKNKSPAVARADTEFVRRERARDFGPSFGPRCFWRLRAPGYGGSF